VVTDPVFIIGKGTAEHARSNAITILKNAKTGINLSTPQAGLHIKGIDGTDNRHIMLEHNSTTDHALIFYNSDLVFKNSSPGGDFYFKNNSGTNLVTITSLGNTNVEGEINRTSTGSANIVPICYGSVASNAVINSGTSNFSIINSTTGQYDVTITGETYTNSGYVTLITVVGGSNFRIATTASSAGQIVIRIFDITGTLVNTAFHFVVYKQ